MKLRTCALTLMILLMANSLFAQEKEVIQHKKHEINIGFTDLFNRSDNNYPSYPYPYYKSLDYIAPPYPNSQEEFDFNTQYGIGYKYHFGKNAIRSLFDIGFDDNETNFNNSGQDDINKNSYSYTNISTRVGYERSFVKEKKFHIYTGADVIIQMAESELKSKNSSANQTSTSTNKSEYDGLGIGGFLGVKFFLHKNISLGTETRVNYIDYTYKEKYSFENTGNFAGSGSNSSENTGNNLDFKPLAVFSINVHF